MGTGAVVPGAVLPGEAGTTAELYDVNTGNQCRLPDLPLFDTRSFHTQNGNLACGGKDTSTTCLQFINGGWITSHQLQTERYHHTSWRTSSGDVLLVGGLGEFQSTELVKMDGTTEMGTLQLKYKSSGACLIDEGDTFLLTGGYDRDTFHLTGGYDTLTAVSRYTATSHVKDLSNLNTGRDSHACGWYVDSDGKRMNIVAGGLDGSNTLDSVEVNVAEQDNWWYGTKLPTALAGLKGVTVMSQFYITGGWNADFKYEDAILHYKGSTSTNNGLWEPVGQMNVSRGYHAVSLVNDVCPTSTSATTSTTWIIGGTALVVVIIQHF